MPKPKQVTEYRELSLEELMQRAQTAYQTLFRLRSEGSIPGNVKPDELIAAKRSLARILTVITEKQRQELKESSL